ncbi:hypothetical protein NPS74_03960, partial [Cutibacterium acnes subsp. acnes]|nr:hypothetical protein [Cutibacterium acnes subsp. acnes]
MSQLSCVSSASRVSSPPLRGSAASCDSSTSSTALSTGIPMPSRHQTSGGTVHVPASIIGALLLGPGTNVTHQAMVLLTESGAATGDI